MSIRAGTISGSELFDVNFLAPLRDEYAQPLVAGEAQGNGSRDRILEFDGEIKHPAAIGATTSFVSEEIEGAKTA